MKPDIQKHYPSSFFKNFDGFDIREYDHFVYYKGMRTDDASYEWVLAGHHFSGDIGKMTITVFDDESTLLIEAALRGIEPEKTDVFGWESDASV